MTTTEYSDTKMQEDEKIAETLEESSDEKSNLIYTVESSENHREFFDRFKTWEQLKENYHISH